MAPDGTLQAVRFDPSTLSVSGRSEPVLDSVSLKSSGAANHDLSSDGHLAFIAGGLSTSANRTIMWVDRTGKESPRDGAQVIFRSSISGNNDLYVVDVDGARKHRALLATEHDERNAALSPDDRFMAFESDLSGRSDIYVRPFPDVDSRQWPVSSGGGAKPVWSANGKELLYVSADNHLMSVPARVVAGSPGSLELGKPVRLFPMDAYFLGAQGRNYDVSPDGRRFVMIKNPPSQTGGAKVQIVLNWAEDLRRRLK